MTPMTFTKPRATLEETLAFANAVRRAGGGNPLDALMPAVPMDSERCLIARNLNFNCHVEGLNHDSDEHLYSDGGNPWVMRVGDADIRHRIAESLGLPLHQDGDDDDGEEVIILPEEIGAVARDFDEARNVVEWRLGARYQICPTATEQELDRFKEFFPYLDESVKETYANATFINKKGELVL